LRHVLITLLLLAAPLAAREPKYKPEKHDKKADTVTCDGNICMEGLTWHNYYAGCFGCIEYVVRGTLVNRSNILLHDVTVHIDIMGDANTILEQAGNGIGTLAPGTRWPFRASAGFYSQYKAGLLPAFARVSKLTLKAPDSNGDMKTFTVGVNLGTVSAR
jgi:hypothetical protein